MKEWRRALGLDWRLVPVVSLVLDILGVLFLLFGSDEVIQVVTAWVIVATTSTILAITLFIRSPYLVYKALFQQYAPYQALQTAQEQRPGNYIWVVVHFANDIQIKIINALLTDLNYSEVQITLRRDNQEMGVYVLPRKHGVIGKLSCFSDQMVVEGTTDLRNLTAAVRIYLDTKRQFWTNELQDGIAENGQMDG